MRVLIAASPNSWIILLVAVTFLATFLLKRKGQGRRTVKTVHKTTTQLKIELKFGQPAGVSTGFPSLHAINRSDLSCTIDRVEIKATRSDGKESTASASISSGTTITQDPGTEIDLSGAFQQIAQELCDSEDAGTPVKINVNFVCGVGGVSVPITSTTMNGKLSYDRLQDFHQG